MYYEITLDYYTIFYFYQNVFYEFSFYEIKFYENLLFEKFFYEKQTKKDSMKISILWNDTDPLFSLSILGYSSLFVKIFVIRIRISEESKHNSKLVTATFEEVRILESDCYFVYMYGVMSGFKKRNLGSGVVSFGIYLGPLRTMLKLFKWAYYFGHFWNITNCYIKEKKIHLTQMR